MFLMRSILFHASQKFVSEFWVLFSNKACISDTHCSHQPLSSGWLGLITNTFSIRLSTSSCLLFHWFQSWKNIKMPNWSSGNIFAKCEQVFRPEGSKYCRSLSKTFQQLYNSLAGFASVTSQTTLPPGNSTPRVVDTPRPRVNTSESWEGGENIKTKNITERQGWVFLIKALLNIWRRKITFLHVHNILLLGMLLLRGLKRRTRNKCYMIWKSRLLKITRCSGN